MLTRQSIPFKMTAVLYFCLFVFQASAQDSPPFDADELVAKLGAGDPSAQAITLEIVQNWDDPRFGALLAASRRYTANLGKNDVADPQDAAAKGVALNARTDAARNVIDALAPLERPKWMRESNDTRLGDTLVQILQDIYSTPESRARFSYGDPGVAYTKYPIESILLSMMGGLPSTLAPTFLPDYILVEKDTRSLSGVDKMATWALCRHKGEEADAAILKLWNRLKGDDKLSSKELLVQMAQSGRVSKEEAKPILFQAAEEGFYPAFATLARYYGGEAAPLLRTKLEQANPQIRRDAIRALGRLGDKASTQKFVGFLANEDEGVRIAAIDALGDVHAVEHVGTLERLVAQSPDEKIKTACIESLGKIPGNESHQALKRLRELDRNNPEWQKKLRNAIHRQEGGVKHSNLYPRMDATPTPTPTPNPN